ncbi:DMT family transporter [Rhizobium alvei]|uniref:DMT family transporter n=1 Tax=Rhizobium alvei TaxID=1132659 RepID=UPI00349833B4
MTAAKETITNQPAITRNATFLFTILAEILLVVAWSGGFVGIRFTIDQAPLFLILFWRSLVSGLILLPFALTIGPRLQWRAVSGQILYGIFAMATYLASYALAIELGVPTGLTALITDLLPLAVALLSWPVLGKALTGRQWRGSIIGFAGVLIASSPALQTGTAPLWAYGLPLFGTLSLALVTLMLKRGGSASAMPVHQSLSIQCLAAAAVFAFFALGEGSLMPVLTLEFAGGILWLVFVATFAAWGIYYVALKTTSAARVTAVLYLSPPVTMIWAYIVFNEPLSSLMFIGLFVSLAGIIMVARG